MDIRGFFGSRVSRSYFWFYLASILWISFAWGMFQSLVTSASIAHAIDLFIRYGAIVFGLVVTVGRMHDIGKSGWFALFPVYNLIVPMTVKGQKTKNRYGPVPLELAPEVARASAALMFVGLFIFGIALLLAAAFLLGAHR